MILGRRVPLLAATAAAFIRRRLSTVEVGTAYENLTVAVFNRLGAQVERVGGAGDQGVDFRGPWSLPNHERFYMVGQCKYYERKRIGPSIIREWEGVMSRQDYDTVGTVVASSGFTAEGVQVALSSVYPMALITLVADDLKIADDAPILLPLAEGRKVGKQGIRGFIWNKAADPFIGRLVVTKKHYDVHMYDLDDPAEFTIQLLWDGKPLPEH
ncbi:hypothetical protein IW140_001183 [Coemansia sp. RSA 1813]|nr:hypothetical protein EV178_004948 [Coemansia sp. RSA 1646]KAJ1770003.1 hypothetical protein LPJ74_003577 [Coemansia sp. RSA 1843]KAJ2092090.1 hypothetical protein IW138_001456 [Coemansia sp. RSA 986]KAJ2216574.1 hypothetical protein EV179_001113 [Coemansia sp. RSA 487]KAJ2572143.1 hypothetical protein IW140_001183 [Coemansia sp. RSA 1813]